MDFSRNVIRMRSFFRVAAVHRIRRNTLIVEELDRIVQFSSVTVRPQNNAVPVLLEHLQGFNGERHGLTYAGVFILNDGAVKIYRYE